MNDRLRSPLLHPLWLTALVVLILNDHVFKHVPALAGAVTGKLSDFAGLVVAPPLLAVLVRARSRTARMACVALVGLGFSAIKLSASCAAAYEALMGALFMPSRVWVDPGDLIALPALLLAERVLRTDEPAALWRMRALTVTALLACVATSKAPEPTMTAVIANQTNAALTVHVSTAIVACEDLPDSGFREATTGDFGAFQRHELGRDEFMALSEDAPCGAAWIRIGDQFDGVVAWHELEPTRVPRRLDSERERRALLLEGTEARLAVKVGSDLEELPPPEEGRPALNGNHDEDEDASAADAGRDSAEGNDAGLLDTGSDDAGP